MTDAATPPKASETLTGQQINLLGELAQLGMGLARKICAEPESFDDAALAFDRVSRAVRLTILLQDKLARAPKPDHPQAQRLKRILTRIAEREHKRNDRTDRQITERLDRDFSGDLLAKPFTEIINLICKDLGLNPDWSILRQEAWALEEAARTTPNSFLAGEGGPRSGGWGLTERSDAEGPDRDLPS